MCVILAQYFQKYQWLKKPEQTSEYQSEHTSSTHTAKLLIELFCEKFKCPDKKIYATIKRGGKKDSSKQGPRVSLGSL